MAEYQKHTTHTDALDTLGTIISEGEKRDAIHVAVFPARCDDGWLGPGDHVAFSREGGITTARNVLAAGPAIGIVDPFLKHPVMEGQWCWVLLYPRQITSLRHVWEHPAFPAAQETETVITGHQLTDTESKAISEQWLRDFCATADVPGFHETIGAALTQQENDYVHFSGVDAHGDIPDEFWHHLAIYTGEAIVSNPAKHFSCSC